MKRSPHESTLVAALVSAALIAVAGSAQAAAPYYVKSEVLVAEDQWMLGGRPPQLTPAPLFKPHDSRTTKSRNWWATSNERTGCAGITLFDSASNRALARVVIDEPAVEYAAGAESAAPPCVGLIKAEDPNAVEPPEGTPPAPEDQFAPEVRFSPTVCLPIVLPPGQTTVAYDVETVGGGRATGFVKMTADDSLGRKRVCAPLGAESHARHPHGLTVYWAGNKLYQVIEHSGLRWNADRTAFQVAETTDEESGFTLEWDVGNPNNPVIANGYMNGHAAHEIVVNQRNGLVFQGNHEDSPGVNWPNWVDVIDTTKANPYGFIDVGFFNAIQGIDVDETTNEVRGATHVGEKVFAFDGDCVPTPNTGTEVPPPAPPGYSLPDGRTGMQMGWNCVRWWVEIRPAFVAAFPDLAGIFAPSTTPLPGVLHQHNLAIDDVNQRSYASIHSIHDAEHTGLSDEEAAPATAEEAEEHFMGRWVVEVGSPTAINPTTRMATVDVRMIDLSNGFGVLKFPNVESITGGGGVSVTGGLQRLMKSFVHAHFLSVDPARKLLLVTGEHTGNLGVVRTDTRQLVEIHPITLPIKGCRLPPPEPGAVAGAEEPHVHGVNVQLGTGTVYVADEGEHCFYESMTVLRPNFSPSQR